MIIVLRVLGILVCSVIVFDLVYDIEKNFMVDIYVNENGEKIINMSCDFVWNFYVWMDVWMK